MDLSSGTYHWPSLGKTASSFPTVTAAGTECDAAVIGAGITGAMVAWTLAKTGRSVVVIDRDTPGWGSTIASTALVQYEPDVSLTDLADKIGHDDAAAAYLLCVGAIEKLARIVGRLGEPCGFSWSSSLYLAKDHESSVRLRTELDHRRRVGIDVRWVDAAELQSAWGVRRPGALLSSTGAAVDPLALTLSLLKDAASAGARVVTGSGPIRWFRKSDRFVIETTRGPEIRAHHLVIATGYEAQTLLEERIVNLDSTFAIATKPVSTTDPWPYRSMIWEDDTPYLYARTLGDGRLLIGDENERFESAKVRDALIETKARTLAGKFQALMPHLSIDPPYRWAGTFGSTHDGLPYAGESPEHPGVLFALAFGGNGMTFGVIIAEFIAAIIQGHPPPQLRLLRFGR